MPEQDLLEAFLKLDDEEQVRAVEEGLQEGLRLGLLEIASYDENGLPRYREALKN